MYNLSLHMLGDPNKAEEVTQDVFLKVFRKAPSFRGDAAFSTWIYRITVNAAKSRMRRHDSTVVLFGDLPADTPEPIESPESELLEEETRLEVAGSLGRLPSRQCHAIMLSCYAGYSPEEIAEIMQISTNAVYILLSRGYEQLRMQLGRTQVKGD